MPRKQAPDQQEIIGRVMYEFKHGELRSGQGGKVRNPKQAIAIALHEAGRSTEQTPAENRRALDRTKQREHRSQSGHAGFAGPTRADLYAEAKRAGVPGRSSMGKADLQRALVKPSH